VVLRAPTTKSAAAGLEEEKKLYVEFFDSFDESKRSRCWMQKKAVESFQEGFEERASKSVGKKFPEYVDGTQRAKAGDSPLLFSGPGTLPIEYTSKMAVPLALQRQNFDADNWFDSYRVFSDRYRVLYGYTGATDSAKRSSRSGSGEDDEEVEIQETEEVDEAARRPVRGGKVAAKFSGKSEVKGAAKGGAKGTKKEKTPAKRSSKGSSNNREHGTEGAWIRYGLRCYAHLLCSEFRGSWFDLTSNSAGSLVCFHFFDDRRGRQWGGGRRARGG
jgi:hypothetical protein